MAFNVNGYNNQFNVTKNDRLPTNNEDQRRENVDVKENSNTLTNDTVALSNTAQLLSAQKDKINALPDMDMDKVEQIKLAIASGNYQIDTEKLASNIAAMDAFFPFTTDK